MEVKLNKSVCLLCGNLAHLKHDSYPGYQDPLIFKIYHCPTCHTAYSLPRVNTQKLYESIYKNGNCVPGYERYWKYYEKVKSLSNPLNYISNAESAYFAVKEILSEKIINKADFKILEIGSGMGYLTYSLKKDKYNIIGLDISKTAVEQAKKTFGDYYVCENLYEYSEKFIESYDIVILTEVIEHIEQPIDFINAITKLLKPQGLTIITTPNRSIYPEDVVWASDSPPVHLWWFSEESMIYIAKKLDLFVNFFDFTFYYKKHYQTIDLSKNTINNFPPSYLNESGELKSNLKGKKNSLMIRLKEKMETLYILKNTYRKILDIFRKDRQICGEKGVVLCALLQKK